MIPPDESRGVPVDHSSPDFLTYYQQTVRQWNDEAVSAQQAVSCQAFGATAQVAVSESLGSSPNTLGVDPYVVS